MNPHGLCTWRAWKATNVSMNKVPGTVVLAATWGFAEIEPDLSGGDDAAATTVRAVTNLQKL